MCNPLPPLTGEADSELVSPFSKVHRVCNSSFRSVTKTPWLDWGGPGADDCREARIRWSGNCSAEVCLSWPRWPIGYPPTVSSAHNYLNYNPRFKGEGTGNDASPTPSPRSLARPDFIAL
ncbi:hypothetical protein J6590_007034 [Homalodisca vitripennis]|nr:hypothetical protein J6590_007034 [Homalodisca vitripennis]